MDETEKIDENEVVTQVPEKRDYEEELLKLIKSDEPPERLKEDLGDYHENDIAAILPELTQEERAKLYRIDIIENMDADDAVDVLEELEDDKKEELIKLMQKDSVKDIKLIDSYDDDMIGSKMTTNFIAVKKNLSIKQAMRAVITEAGENDNISTLYAVNDDDTFYGAIDLKDLIRARDGTPLDNIITTAYPYVYAKETVEECIDQKTLFPFLTAITCL